MNAQQNEIMKYWYAFIYERDEDEAEMIAYLRDALGPKPRCILEVACGGGKLSAPLAEAGHDVTGIDRDESMLRYACQRAESLPNLHIRKADIITESWGRNFDVVILGANLLVNIVTEWDYKQAQKRLIDRAAESLKRGGRLFIDYDCPFELSNWGPANREWVCFEGTDDRGTHGRYIVVNGTADARTRIVTGSRRWEITPANSTPFTHTAPSLKYFPPLEQTCTWLYRAGFTVESIHGSYQGEAFDSNHRRAVIWARKA